MYLWAFLFSLYNLFLVLYFRDLRIWLVKFQSFWIYWCSFCGLVHDLFLKMFHVHLRRMCILLLLVEVFCRCPLGPSVLICCSVLLCLYLFFCLVDLSFGVSGMLKSPKMNALHSVTPFNSVSSCFTYVGDPVLSA